MMMFVLNTLTLLAATSASASPDCSSDLDCQLNGVCNTKTGDCKCDAAWTGIACETLHLLPPKSVVPAYPPPSLAAGLTSWGGSVVRSADGDGNGDGGGGSNTTYHMFLAEMLNGCGMETWTTNSIIRHAVSDTPTGPFEQKEVIMHPFAHNPTALQAPDGTYLIYHIGCGTINNGKAPCNTCSGGISGKTCPSTGETVACTDNTTNILYSKSLNGPWAQLNAPIVKSATMGTPYQVDNPTVVFFPNGSLLMLGRGGDPKHEASTDGYITAPSWRGPYTMHTEIGTPGNARWPAVEDPFVWIDQRNNFHALFHKFTDEHPGCGGHAFSTDGRNWILNNTNAYTTDVTLQNGGVVPSFRRERPHLLFDAKGNPEYLYTSLTNWSQQGNDKAYTFVQEINSENH